MRLHGERSGRSAAAATVVVAVLVALAGVSQVAAFSGGEHKEAGSRGWNAAIAAVILGLPEVRNGPGVPPSVEEVQRMVKEVDDYPTLPFTSQMQIEMEQHGCFSGPELDRIVPSALSSDLCAIIVALGISPADPLWRREKTLRISNAVKLPYGSVVAMAGDFYGIPTKPISTPTGKEERKEAFRGAFGTLGQDTKVGEKSAFLRVLSDVSEMIDEEQNKVVKAFDSGLPGSDVYKKLSRFQMHDINFAIVTREISEQFFNRYLALAANNYDHFGVDAEHAYVAGHSVAMEEAAKAGRALRELLATTDTSAGLTGEHRGETAMQSAHRVTTTVRNVQRLLQRALAMNAHADHFLTDLFAAGHLRTPRRRLQVQCPFGIWLKRKRLRGSSGSKGTKEELQTGKLKSNGLRVGVSGDIMSKLMHDEDNKRGLNVVTRFPEDDVRHIRYITFGDNKYFDSGNADGDEDVVVGQRGSHPTRIVSALAVRGSILDILRAFLTGEPLAEDEWHGMKYAPDLGEATRANEDDETRKPLYRVGDGHGILQRTEDGTYKSECGAPPTAFELELLARAAN